MSLFNFGALFYQHNCKHIYFGAYPTDSQIEHLEKENTDFIINLTFEDEKHINPYQTVIPVIRYSIQDNHIPTDYESFSSLIIWICSKIIQTESIKIFIHCKGGHGRSCMVATCIIYYLTKWVTRECIKYITEQHNNRMDMSDRWKTIRSPFTKTQKAFIYKFLNPICILKAYTIGYQAGFSSLSLFSIQTDLGLFPNIDSAFEAYKEKYKDFTDEQIIQYLTRLKYTQHPELRIILLSTGIKHIFDLSRYAFGGNLIGKALMNYRQEIVLSTRLII